LPVALISTTQEKPRALQTRFGFWLRTAFNKLTGTEQ
jgi:hypothetical protein